MLPSCLDVSGGVIDQFNNSPSLITMMMCINISVLYVLYIVGLLRSRTTKIA